MMTSNFSLIPAEDRATRNKFDDEGVATTTLDEASVSAEHMTFPKAHEVSSDSDESFEKVQRGGAMSPFPFKVHDMLESVDRGAIDSSIVQWLPHGRAFMVHKPVEFVQHVLPIFFNQTKFASFQRQLNLYGFHRLQQGTDRGAYYHKTFLRGRRSLCQKMARQKVKGTRIRRGHGSISTEPNLYGLPFMPTTNASRCGEQQLPTIAKPMTMGSSPGTLSASNIQTRIHIPKPTPSLQNRSRSRAVSIGSPSKKKKTRAKGPLSVIELGTGTTTSPQRQYYGGGTTTVTPPTTPRDEYPSMAGDLLFFEGKPFHYMESNREQAAPPPTPAVVEQESSNA